MTLPALYIRRRHERRVRRGHPWVYSNEVDIERSPITGFNAGDCVNVVTHSGRAIGSAYLNPHSLICARIYSRKADRALDEMLIAERLREALALREILGWLPWCRLVHGESDRLPGLVVDRYGDVLAAQIGTAGMERARAAIVSALVDMFRPAALVLRNDLASRVLEGLDQGVEVVHGELPERLVLEENGARFEISPRDGQKTGWYYDQRCNRALAASLAAGRTVLDCFSYAGGFGIQAARAGARSVLCVDSSESALERVARNADLNDVADRLEWRRGDAFETLRALREEARVFDMVIVDPPAFMRRRKDRRAGLEAYRRLNRRAIQVLAEGGLLLSASCSSHLGAEDHQATVAAAADDIGRWIQVLVRGHQAADHPVHPALAESEYLKALVVRVVSP